MLTGKSNLRNVILNSGENFNTALKFFFLNFNTALPIHTVFALLLFLSCIIPPVCHIWDFSNSWEGGKPHR